MVHVRFYGNRKAFQDGVYLIGTSTNAVDPKVWTVFSLC
jgi:hypothetical protein